MSDAAWRREAALDNRHGHGRFDDVRFVRLFRTVGAGVIHAISLGHICLRRDNRDFSAHKLFSDRVNVAFADVAKPLILGDLNNDLLDGQRRGELFLCALWLARAADDVDFRLGVAALIGQRLGLVEQRLLLYVVVKDIARFLAGRPEKRLLKLLDSKRKT